MKSKKGFTLVELLAVIVVLAIIMIIAIPNVLSSMDTAKKNSLVIEARKAITYAMQKVQEDALTGGTPASCYTFDSLGMDTGGKYEGRVAYASASSTYTVYIWDKTSTMGINGKTSAQLSNLGSSDYVTTKPTVTCS